MIVNALVNTADVLLGLVTRTFQRWVPNVASTWVLTVTTIVVGLTTCVVVICGAIPWPPSKLRTAPLIKPEPVIVKFTVVFAAAVFGVMLRMAGCGVGVTVGNGAVTVGMGTVGEGGGAVRLGAGVIVTTVAVGMIGANVKVGEGVSVAMVGDGMGEAVGVITIGLPNSLQPRSGAAPINPVSGCAGTASPPTVMYCATPLSMAGEFP